MTSMNCEVIESTEQPVAKPSNIYFPLNDVQNLLTKAGVYWKMEGQEIKADIGKSRWAISIKKQICFNLDTGKGSKIYWLLKNNGLLDSSYVSVSRESVSKIKTKSNTGFIAKRMWDGAVDMTKPGHIKDELALPFTWAVMYFKSRFCHLDNKDVYTPEHTEAFKYSRIALPDAKWDKEFIDQGCKVVVFNPMYNIYTKELCGIQRTYLGAKGLKLGRKMLGEHGYLLIKGSNEPIEKDMVLLGEGFETTLAGVLLSGCSAIVGYDTAGVSRQADHWATESKLTLTIGLLVDMDKSKAGEKTCSKAAVQLTCAGIKALMLKPQTALPEGVKSIDWLDEFQNYGMVAGRLAIQVALKDANTEYVINPLSSNVISMAGVRVAESPLMLAETVSMVEARTITRDEITGFINDASGWNLAKKNAKEYLDYIKVNPMQKRLSDLAAYHIDENNKFSLIPPTTALQITTGVGKSHAVRDIIARLKKNRLPAVIVVKDKEAASVYESAGAEWRHGRECNPEGFKVEWHCPHADANGNVARLADAEQLIGSAMCNTGHCDHGNRLMLDVKDINSGDPAKQPSATVIKWYKNKVEEIGEAGIEAIEPCGFLPHMKKAQSNMVIVVTSAGLGGNELFYIEKPQGDKKGQAVAIPRMVIIDEAVKWQHSRIISGDIIASYVNQIALIYSKISAMEDTNSIEILKLLEQAEKLYREISLELGKASGTQGCSLDASVALTNLALEIGDITEERKQAMWEKPVWNNLTELDMAPLRSAYEITIAAQQGRLTIIDGALQVVYTHPVVSEAIGQQPVLILDATLDSSAKAIVRARQGKIVDIRAKQNLSVIVDPRRFRGAVVHEGEREERLDKEVNEMFEMLTSKTIEKGRDIYIIAQKPKAIRLLAKVSGVALSELEAMSSQKIQEISVAHRIGWWGRHDKGIDNWKGYNGILWDQSAIRMEEIRKGWVEYRSLRISYGTNPESVPHWTDEWVNNEWIPMGQYDQQSRARVHANPEIRAFILDHINDQRMQAIGRARAACSEDTISIWILGGLPMPQLREHGIAVEYEAVGSSTRSERATQEHKQRIGDIKVAALKVVANGKQITRDAIEEEMDKLVSGKTRVHSYTNFVVDYNSVYFGYMSDTGRNAKIIVALADIKKNNMLSDIATAEILEQIWSSTVAKCAEGEVDGTMFEAAEQVEDEISQQLATSIDKAYWQPRLDIIKLVKDELDIYENFDFDTRRFNTVL